MRALTIEDMRQMAKDRDGTFLSKEYIDRDVNHTWRCKKGHVFELWPRFVQRGAWCKKCNQANEKEQALELMQEWAEARGGKCLSKKYVNCATPLTWECESGHVFERTRDDVKQRKNWCAVCNSIAWKEKKLKEMQELAKGKGGKCLSKRYKGLNSLLNWECKEGHTWKARPLQMVFNDSWCSYCYGNAKYTMQQMQELAKSKKGKCLSKRYTNSVTPLKWECAKGHVWKSAPRNLIYWNTWCPKCAPEKMRLTRKRNAKLKKSVR